jgi:putative hydrolase of the HAD superfamily
MRILVTGVLLDLDGTLLDHDGAAHAAFLSACAGWLPNADRVMRDAAVGTWKVLEVRYMQQFLNGAMTFQEQRRARVRGILDAYGDGSGRRTDADLDALFDVYRKAYEAAWRPYDDVPEAMRVLCQAPGGVAVLSNGDRRQQEAKLAAVGLDPAPRLFVPADLGAAKPERASFLGACAAMGWDPADVVHVGDNLATDALAARSAGLAGCWLQRGPAGGHPVDPPMLRIARIRALTELGDILRWRVATS